MLEKGTRLSREKEGNETRSKCEIKKTSRGSIKSNPMLRGDMDHDVSTGGRHKQLVFLGQIWGNETGLHFRKVVFL